MINRSTKRRRNAGARYPCASTTPLLIATRSRRRVATPRAIPQHEQRRFSSPRPACRELIRLCPEEGERVDERHRRQRNACFSGLVCLSRVFSFRISSVVLPGTRRSTERLPRADAASAGFRRYLRRTARDLQRRSRARARDWRTTRWESAIEMRDERPSQLRTRSRRRRRQADISQKEGGGIATRRAGFIALADLARGLDGERRRGGTPKAIVHISRPETRRSFSTTYVSHAAGSTYHIDHIEQIVARFELRDFLSLIAGAKKAEDVPDEKDEECFRRNAADPTRDPASMRRLNKIR